MKIKLIIEQLKKYENPDALKGMAKYGIIAKKAFGVSIPNLRIIANKIGKNHELAQQLWQEGIHETRILASMIDEPNLVTEEQMEKWVNDFYSWDLCDQCCNNLFRKTKSAYKKAFEWSSNNKEFIKRAAFTLIACLAVHDKEAPNEVFENFFPLIRKAATDNRNFVKKAVNWALRQIGKRNILLNKKALSEANEIIKINSKIAGWIASDAIRELNSEKIQNRLKMVN
jgi:3-methyladenine DNA glycosylase AlkD